MSSTDSLVRELHGPILVLGASGFIGANLLRMLLEQREDVYGTATRLPAWRLEGLPRDHVLVTDLLIDSNLDALLENVKPRTIFDCIAYGAYSFETDRELIYRTNFNLISRLLGRLDPRSVEAAVAVADRIGYPVAMKAQAAKLEHKTEAGGVMLGIANAEEVRGAWKTLHDNVARAQSGLKLDGVLVEAMSPRGLELVVGARRDPRWGPVVMVGLGGIWVEALGDVRLMPPDLGEAEIVGELQKLKTAKLLNGFRGSPPVDLNAVAAAAAVAVTGLSCAKDLVPNT